jgi:hypothetical protein
VGSEYSRPLRAPELRVKNRLMNPTPIEECQR